MAERVPAIGIIGSAGRMGRAIAAILPTFDATPAGGADSGDDLTALTHAADVLVRGYSMGMRKKLLLARALLHKPQILYLDEPTANLDIHSAGIVHRLLRQHVKEGGTVLLTTHNMHEVEEVCDRVLFLSHGRILLEGDPRRLPGEHGRATLEDLFITLAREPLALERA